MIKCKNCFGTGEVGDPEVGGEEGLCICPFCRGWTNVEETRIDYADLDEELGDNARISIYESKYKDITHEILMSVRSIGFHTAFAKSLEQAKETVEKLKLRIEKIVEKLPIENDEIDFNHEDYETAINMFADLVDDY